MVLINGEYLVDEVSEADVRWAMGLAVSALQRPNPPRLGRLLQQGSRRDYAFDWDIENDKR